MFKSIWRVLGFLNVFVGRETEIQTGIQIKTQTEI